MYRNSTFAATQFLLQLNSDSLWVLEYMHGCLAAWLPGCGAKFTVFACISSPLRNQTFLYILF